MSNQKNKILKKLDKGKTSLKYNKSKAVISLLRSCYEANTPFFREEDGNIRVLTSSIEFRKLFASKEDPENKLKQSKNLENFWRLNKDTFERVQKKEPRDIRIYKVPYEFRSERPSSTFWEGKLIQATFRGREEFNEALVTSGVLGTPIQYLVTAIFESHQLDKSRDPTEYRIALKRFNYQITNTSDPQFVFWSWILELWEPKKLLNATELERVRAKRQVILNIADHLSLHDAGVLYYNLAQTERDDPQLQKLYYNLAREYFRKGHFDADFYGTFSSELYYALGEGPVENIVSPPKVPKDVDPSIVDLMKQFEQLTIDMKDSLEPINNVRYLLRKSDFEFRCSNLEEAKLACNAALAITDAPQVNLISESLRVKERLKIIDAYNDKLQYTLFLNQVAIPEQYETEARQPTPPASPQRFLSF